MSTRHDSPEQPLSSRPASWARNFLLLVAGLSLVLLIVWLVVAYVLQPEIAATPGVEDIANPERQQQIPARDVWGVSTFDNDGKARDEAGAVIIDEATLELGRRAFYEETFGNERVITHVLGILDGPVTVADLTQAITDLGGEGTTNLRVKLSKSVVVAGRTFEEGTVIDTGLDVAKGSVVPLGMSIKYVQGQLQVGMTCALCHVAVDPQTGQVVEGAPNADVNAGLLLALAPNTAVFLQNADIPDLAALITDHTRTVTDAHGNEVSIPDPQALEDAVDEALLRWPPGYFDSTNDLVGNPSQIPDTFTLGDHPYGWTGFAAAGPFRGLSVLSNNVHGLNADPFANAGASALLYGLDKEAYIATLLQNAANADYRYDLKSGKKPSEFLKSLNPHPDSPALSDTIPLPTYPQASFLAPNSLWISPQGHPVWRHVNAISAFENTLAPPQRSPPAAAERFQAGRAIFEQGGCAKCHAGPFLTNNRVIPVEEIGTSAARAPAMQKTERDMASEMIGYTFDTPVPLPDNPSTLSPPEDHIDLEQVRLAWAHGGTQGGYKVKGLLGLRWSAPYLHDGGVAVGPNAETQFGVPGTLLVNIPPDPANSLRALVDRKLRAKVVAANEANTDLQKAHIQGVGHEFWIDEESQFTDEEQGLLIEYLLNVGAPKQTD